jgi:hypothetical protein
MGGCGGNRQTGHQSLRGSARVRPRDQDLDRLGIHAHFSPWIRNVAVRYSVADWRLIDRLVRVRQHQRLVHTHQNAVDQQ